MISPILGSVVVADSIALVGVGYLMSVNQHPLVAGSFLLLGISLVAMTLVAMARKNKKKQ